MKLFVVRQINDKQAVGFFWASRMESLLLMIDEITNADDCEFQEVDEDGGFGWSDDVPAIGVELKDAPGDEISPNYYKLTQTMEPYGSFENFFHGDNIGAWDSLRLQVPKSEVPRPSRPTPEPPSNTVYFIGCGDYIKIGVTNDSVKKRMKTLSTAHHQELVLLATIENAPGDLEFSLHQQFAKYRERGEWFRKEPELLEYIESLKQGTV